MSVMAGGKHRPMRTPRVETRKGILLSADERAAALRMRAYRMSAQDIAKALVRSVIEVQAFLASPEAKHG